MKLDLGFLGIPTYKVHKILRNSQKFLYSNSKEFLEFPGIPRISRSLQVLHHVINQHPMHKVYANLMIDYHLEKA